MRLSNTPWSLPPGGGGDARGARDGEATHLIDLWQRQIQHEGEGCGDIICLQMSFITSGGGGAAATVRVLCVCGGSGPREAPS